MTGVAVALLNGATVIPAVVVAALWAGWWVR